MTDLVEIIITGKDLSKKAFEEAKASGSSMGSVLSKVGLAGGAALAAIAVEAVKMAATYQSAVTRLATSAGESTANLNMVSKGMLDMAGKVGMSATELAKGMYTVESAGYHGADGLIVLKAAAQGAKDENADLGTVANAVTDVLTDYHLKASDAADVTSKLVTAVSFGKTTFESFSKAMSNILPLSGAVHLSLADVSGVLAEMTAHGMTAQRASQNEAQAIRSLIAPSGTMVKEFKLLGISSQEVMSKLGTVGLAGTMQWLSTVAQTGSKAVGQNYVEALKKLMGTAPGLSVALMTTGENAASTAAAIAGIGKATKDSNGDVKGFAEVQKTLSQQLSQVDAWFNSMMIRLGTALIPKVSEFLSLLESKGGPVLSGFQKILGQVAAGFDGIKRSVDAVATPVATIMGAFTGTKASVVGGERVIGAGKQQSVARLPGGERVILPAAAAAIAQSVKIATPVPPDLVVWQKVGSALAGVASDFSKFAADAAKALGNLVSALQPTAVLLGGAFLLALTNVAQILGSVVGPALVAVTGFMNEHKGAVRDLIAVALIPLALRLSALAIIKPVTAIAGLAVDIVKFPFVQAKAIGTAISTGWDTARGVWGGMRFAAVTVKDLAVSGWEKVASGAAAAGRGVASLASTGWTGLVSGLKGVGTGLKAAGDASLDFSKKAIIATGAAIRQAAAFVWEKASAVAAAIAEGTMTAAQWLLDLAMNANPIGAVILAITALIGIYVLLYNKSEEVREITATMWGLSEMSAATAARAILIGVRSIIDIFDEFISIMINGAADAFGWIPGIGGQLKGAARDFDNFKKSVNASFNSAIAKTEQFNSAAQKATEARVLQVKINGWTDNLNKAKQQLASVPPSKRADLLANIAQLTAQISKAQDAINALKGKTITITYKGVNEGSIGPNGYQPSNGSTPYATGGITSAAATGGARGGLVQINEYGPELVRLPTGSMVYPTGQSRGMAAAAGGGVLQVQLEWVGSNGGDDLMRFLRKNIRITAGGNVQKALGTT